MTNYQQILDKLNEQIKLQPPVYIDESIFNEENLKKLVERLRDQKGE